MFKTTLITTLTGYTIGFNLGREDAEGGKFNGFSLNRIPALFSNSIAEDIYLAAYREGYENYCQKRS
jgi:hypothetical protein